MAQKKKRKKKISWKLIAGICLVIAIICAGIFLVMSPADAPPAATVEKEIDPNPTKPSNDYFSDGGEIASRNAIRKQENDSISIDFINKNYEHLDMYDSTYESRWTITVTGSNDKPVNGTGNAVVKYTGNGVLNDPASWKIIKATVQM